MSPSELAIDSFSEEKKAPSKIKKEPKANKGSQEDMISIPTQMLEKIMTRMDDLEKRENSRIETEKAKRNVSRIFQKWDHDMGPGLSLNDLSDRSNPSPKKTPQVQRPRCRDVSSVVR